MNIKIYADGANIEQMKQHFKKNYVKGFTTNPSLMKKSGIKNYLEFTYLVAKKFGKMPISIEVFADDLESMEEQAYKIGKISKNIFVKIPITNTKGVYTTDLIKSLSKQKIKTNVTAVFTKEQIRKVSNSIIGNTETIISIFAGRIANTGVDPEPIIKYAVKLNNKRKNIKILWASAREIFNLVQAKRSGCHIITLPNNLLGLYPEFGKNLTKYSLETVREFYKDAKSANYKI